MNCKSVRTHQGRTHRPYLWMDFTGDGLQLHYAIMERGGDHLSIPFDLTLHRNDLGPQEAHRVMAEASMGQGVDQIELTAFHRHLPLLAGLEKVLNLLWCCFFHSIKGKISFIPQQSSVIALIPTAWSPQVAAGLSSGFFEVFGIYPNFCTTAVAGLFHGLTEMRTMLASHPVGHQKNFSKSLFYTTNISEAETFAYQLEKQRQDVLKITLTDWQYIKPYAEKTSGADKTSTIPPDEAFKTMLTWLDQPDHPRVGLDMRLCLGFLDISGKFVPLRFSDDPACHWIGRRFTQAEEQGDTIALAAKPCMGQNVVPGRGPLFPMANIVLEYSPNSRPEKPIIMLRPLDHDRMAVWVTDQGGGHTDLMKTQARLPRLYH